MAQNVIQSLGAPPIRRHVQENQGVGPNVVRCESEWDAREVISLLIAICYLIRMLL